MGTVSVDDMVEGAGVADLHTAGVASDGGQTVGSHGSHGTPAVTPFAATELGVLLDGRVAEWVARRVARATAEAGLMVDQARWVAARIIEADPEAAEERRRAVMRRRQVALGRSNCFGLRTLTAHTTGQTRLANLGPLGRSHHNAKTLGGWRLHQPEPGTYYWRTPTGPWSRVDGGGTTYLGTRRPHALRGPPPARPAARLAARPSTRPRSPAERRLARSLAHDVAAGVVTLWAVRPAG